MSRQWEWMKKQMKSGRCKICGQPLATSYYCTDHAKQDSERNKKKYHQAKRTKAAKLSG